jgi:hypothetical protein
MSNVCGIIVPAIEDILSFEKLEFRFWKFFVVFLCSFLVVASMFVSGFLDRDRMMVVMLLVLFVESIFFFVRVAKVAEIFYCLDALISDWDSVRLSISRIAEGNHVSENVKRVAELLPKVFIFTTVRVSPFLNEVEADNYQRYCLGIYRILSKELFEVSLSVDDQIVMIDQMFMAIVHGSLSEVV